MAGHIQDRWYKTETSADGKSRKVRTDRYGTGMRYRARYVGPDGTEKSKSFPDRQKRQADEWLTRIEADMASGHYIDPKTTRTTFQQYAERWLASQTTDPSTRVQSELRLRRHAFPHIGSRPLGSFQPIHIRELTSALEEAGLGPSYRRDVFTSVRAVLSAAVDDGLLLRNPCSAKSVKAPRPEPRRVEPWSAARVFSVRNAFRDDRYRAMVDAGAGCGLRQGEIFGLSVDAVNLSSNTLHVVRQVKYLQGRLLFAPPKGGKLRDVPLPESVASSLRAHMERFPPVNVALPWLTADGPLVTHRLLFTLPTGVAVRRNYFNDEIWKEALEAAGVIAPRRIGQRPTAAREHGMHALRHFYASVLLDAGESIKAVSEYLGHADPGFTLRIYTHLMPSSRERTRKAVDAVFGHDSGR